MVDGTYVETIVDGDSCALYFTVSAYKYAMPVSVYIGILQILSERQFWCGSHKDAVAIICLIYAF